MSFDFRILSLLENHWPTGAALAVLFMLYSFSMFRIKQIEKAVGGIQAELNRVWKELMVTSKRLSEVVGYLDGKKRE